MFARTPKKQRPTESHELSFSEFRARIYKGIYEDSWQACEAIEARPHMSDESHADAYARCYHSWKNPTKK